VGNARYLEGGLEASAMSLSSVLPSGDPGSTIAAIFWTTEAVKVVASRTFCAFDLFRGNCRLWADVGCRGGSEGACDRDLVPVGMSSMINLIS